MITSDTSRIPITVAAQRRGVTSRWTGLTAMTSMAASSSRMLRAPMSAVIAEPPAPAISSAAAIGAASRTTPTITAAPVSDSAPSWRVSWPIWREMVAPSGTAMSITGVVVTLIRNRHWSTNSGHHRPISHVRRSPSSAVVA
jgi:hypothetical protein